MDEDQDTEMLMETAPEGENGDKETGAIKLRILLQTPLSSITLIETKIPYRPMPLSLL